jgi:hypothetical protein
MCGDSTKADHVAALLAGARPHLMVTDPPYGVEYDPAWRNEPPAIRHGWARHLGAGARRSGNDDRADWREAWALFPAMSPMSGTRRCSARRCRPRLRPAALSGALRSSGTRPGTYDRPRRLSLAARAVLVRSARAAPGIGKARARETTVWDIESPFGRSRTAKSDADRPRHAKADRVHEAPDRTIRAGRLRL